MHNGGDGPGRQSRARSDGGAFWPVHPSLARKHRPTATCLPAGRRPGLRRVMRRPLIRRKRQRSIRVLLTAIFVVPLASLIGLWAFAASVAVPSAVREHNFNTENNQYGGAAQGLGEQPG